MSGDTEIYFYHLEHRSLEQVLPTLLERSLERGWRAVVQAASRERVEALNTLLWTYRIVVRLTGSTRAGKAVAATAGLAGVIRGMATARAATRGIARENIVVLLWFVSRLSGSGLRAGVARYVYNHRRPVSSRTMNKK